jgi:hypothetical protein
VKIFGPYFDQELRSGDNCGIYSMQNQHVLHFELFQEGTTRVDLYCLDQIMVNVSNNVTPWPRETDFSIIHKNQDMSNVCVRNSNLVFFAKGWVTRYSPEILGDSVFINQKMRDFAVQAVTIEVGFLFQFTENDVRLMTAFEKFEKILLVAFGMSRKCDAVIFRYGMPVFLSLIQKVTQGKVLTQSPVCVKRMIVGLDPKIIQALTVSELQQLRRLAIEPAGNRSDLVFISQSKISSEIVGSGVANFVEIADFSDLEMSVKNLSVAKAFVTYDEEDKVIGAFWMPENSPLIVIVPPKRKKVSKALIQVLATGRTVVKVEGEVAGAASQKSELFAKCMDGKLDVESEECGTAFVDLVFHVNQTKVVEILKAIE